MKILLTGTSSFIGRNLNEKLTGYALFVPTSKQLNLLNKNSVVDYVKSNHIDVILNCANWNAHTDSTKDVSKVLTNNLIMFHNVADCYTLVDKIIYFGSGAEFDRTHWKNCMKEDYFGVHVPEDGYGLSKYVMCKYAEQIKNIYNLRLFGVFGPYEDCTKRFVSYCITKALKNETIEMKQNCAFDYLWIDDLIPIVSWFLDSKPKHSAYNVCTNTRYELLSLAKKIVKLSQHNVAIKVFQDGLGSEYSGDNSLLLREVPCNFTPIGQAIQNLILWYKGKKI